MMRSWVLWLLAFVITAGSALYQRVTGPTYPVRGTATVGSAAASYRLLRSQETSAPAPVEVTVPDSTVRGRVEWRRYNTDDPWTLTAMQWRDGVLSATVPVQPPAGKVAYRIILTSDGRDVRIPGEGEVVLRYKGEVPAAILIIHVIAMFGAMLLSTRAGLEAFSVTQRYHVLTSATVVFLAIGGLILGPIVQKYAFGAFWTGWPVGHDLTDNKTFFALLCWVVALFAIRRGRHAKGWALGAATVTFLVFMIPHSVLGSELEYKSLQTPEAVQPVSGDAIHRP